MRRVGMTGLLERRVAAAAVFGETQLRFQRPSARQSQLCNLRRCSGGATPSSRTRGGYQSRCEQAQSGGRTEKAPKWQTFNLWFRSSFNQKTANILKLDSVSLSHSRPPSPFAAMFL